MDRDIDERPIKHWAEETKYENSSNEEQNNTQNKPSNKNYEKSNKPVHKNASTYNNQYKQQPNIKKPYGQYNSNQSKQNNYKQNYNKQNDYNRQTNYKENNYKSFKPENAKAEINNNQVSNPDEIEFENVMKQYEEYKSDNKAMEKKTTKAPQEKEDIQKEEAVTKEEDKEERDKGEQKKQPKNKTPNITDYLFLTPSEKSNIAYSDKEDEETNENNETEPDTTYDKNSCVETQDSSCTQQNSTNSSSKEQNSIPQEKRDVNVIRLEDSIKAHLLNLYDEKKIATPDYYFRHSFNDNDYFIRQYKYALSGFGNRTIPSDKLFPTLNRNGIRTMKLHTVIDAVKRRWAVYDDIDVNPVSKPSASGGYSELLIRRIASALSHLHNISVNGKPYVLR